MAIILTVNANTYISLADANSYFTNRIFSSSWTGTDDLKSQALIEATKHIERQIYKGRKAIYTQTLQFPRAIYCPEGYNIRFLNTILYTQDWYVEQEVSTEVKQATCEEALAILVSGARGNKRAELQAQGVKSFKLGNMSEEYVVGGKSNKLMSIEATQLMKKYTGGVQIC